MLLLFVHLLRYSKNYSSSISFSHHRESSKNTIPSTICHVNTKNSPGVLGNEMFGPTKETINHAAEIFIKSPDNVLKRGRGSLLTRLIFANGD
jgi:hypothetical protein